MIGSGSGLKVDLIDFKTYPYPEQIKKDILLASSPETSRIDRICSLNFFLGEIFAEAALKIMKKNHLKKKDVSCIGSHGQTIYHIPPTSARKQGFRPSTLQIGEPSLIAERTGITTVSDFRPRDIAAGGMGAPLTPYVHYLLFRDKKENRAVLNIGGISNITVIPPENDIDKVIAFDTGPGNMIIDGVVSVLTKGRKKYDCGGRTALHGSADKKLLQFLMAHPYMKKSPPKSTGREEFGKSLIDDILKRAQKKKLHNEDLIRTVTAYTAESIIVNLKRFVLKKYPLSRVIVGGGGAKNITLLSLLREGLGGISIQTMDDFGYSSDGFEAMAFAVLAQETLSGAAGNLPHVTGAKKKVILGKIIPGTTGFSVKKS
jgi:anhydro-N-acetylmuramic acid kinase